ncbi:MAG: alpha/beta hydrolase [Myxococcota bacterium]
MTRWVRESRDARDLVRSLALLEPALVASVPSGATFWEEVARIESTYERGDRAGATDAFLAGVLGPEYRQLLEKFLPPGAFELAVADIDTLFQVELEALRKWSFTAEDAARIGQPVLAVIGDESEPIFHEVHSVLRQWIPHVEELVVPQANHALEYINPSAVADGLARFLAKTAQRERTPS